MIIIYNMKNMFIDKRKKKMKMIYIYKVKKKKNNRRKKFLIEIIKNKII